MAEVLVEASSKRRRLRSKQTPSGFYINEHVSNPQALSRSSHCRAASCLQVDVLSVILSFCAEAKLKAKRSSETQCCLPVCREWAFEMMRLHVWNGSFHVTSSMTPAVITEFGDAYSCLVTEGQRLCSHAAEYLNTESLLSLRGHVQTIGKVMAVLDTEMLCPLSYISVELLSYFRVLPEGDARLQVPLSELHNLQFQLSEFLGALQAVSSVQRKQCRAMEVHARSLVKLTRRLQGQSSSLLLPFFETVAAAAKMLVNTHSFLQRAERRVRSMGRHSRRTLQIYAREIKSWGTATSRRAVKKTRLKTR
eukprot:TRINITY_DN15820_c0_g2_i1.p1 TRINITY_DN15820_c0_g2~~TRINITY_DN15820_c0_g2_i1.p1  ORF type:complete len:308 (-),score=34.00 TRINITY_DN15820_c0_g2_i1:497-1420(-)